MKLLADTTLIAVRVWPRAIERISMMVLDLDKLKPRRARGSRTLLDEYDPSCFHTAVSPSETRWLGNPSAGPFVRGSPANQQSRPSRQPVREHDQSKAGKRQQDQIGGHPSCFLSLVAYAA